MILLITKLKEKQKTVSNCIINTFIITKTSVKNKSFSLFSRIFSNPMEKTDAPLSGTVAFS